METVPDRVAVREQLERMLDHPLLKSSKRTQSFLRFVVEESLNGRAEDLKERTVGVAVFAKDAEYDTNLDHVVRTAASDIRRRLALYYQEPGRGNELRILLPPGGYAPIFQPPFEVAAKSPSPAPVPAPIGSPASRRKRVLYVAAGLAVLAGAAVFAREIRFRPAIAMDRFWAPFVNSPDPVLMCVGTFFVPDSVAQQADTAPTEFTRYVQHAMSDLLVTGDVSALTRVSGVLTVKGKKFRIRSQSNCTLPDLREGPALLIGAFNNQWSVRLTNHLRFSFVWESGGSVLRIKDRRNPASDKWQANAKWAMETAPRRAAEDFALVSRVWDPTTGRPVLILGGLTMGGTIAAGEFVSEQRYLDQFAASAPKGWELRNLQIVIRTQLIGTDSGPPEVQAVESW
jgi:hypothetical protein